jgi:hypothetical protein
MLAKSEYELAAVWYDEARVGLGIEFEAAVEAVLNEAAPSYLPRLCKSREKHCRVAEKSSSGLSVFLVQ